MKKNSIWQKFLAFILSILVVLLIFPTIFTVPLEFLIMTETTYSALSTNEKLVEAGQDAFSGYIAAQLNTPGENENVPSVFSNEEILIQAIKPFITREWLSATFSDMSSQLLQFFNFKQPFGIVKIDLGEIKASVLTGREDLAESILNASAPCSSDEMRQLTSTSLSIREMPLCNPSDEIKDDVVAVIADYIETFLYKIPGEYPINVEQGIQVSGVANPIAFYSLIRWLFRIVPIVWLVILILIGICLWKNRSEMRTWIGRLLIFASVLCLILLLVLLIGSEQFTALFINQTFSGVDSAFGTILLIALQAVTYKALIWMGIISMGIFLVGFFLLFFNKWNDQRKIAAERKQEEIQYQKAAEEMLETKQAMAEAVEEEPGVEEQVEEVEEPEEEIEEKNPPKKPARKTKKKEE